MSGELTLQKGTNDLLYLVNEEGLTAGGWTPQQVKDIVAAKYGDTGATGADAAGQIITALTESLGPAPFVDKTSESALDLNTVNPSESPKGSIVPLLVIAAIGAYVVLS